METLKDIILPVVVLGVLGRFIDFLIGKAGQERAKDFLLRWWVRFDDVRWRNFGKEEGLFAGSFIDKWFGPRIWSRRRIVMAFLIFVLLIMSGYSKFVASPNPEVTFCLGCNDNARYGFIDTGEILILDDKGVAITNLIGGYCSSRNLGSIGWVSLFLSIFAFCISVSFTKFVTSRIARLCGIGELRNISVFILMLVINYLILAFWLPIKRNATRTGRRGKDGDRAARDRNTALG